MAKSCNSCNAINPFTRSHYDQLKEAQRKITDLAGVLDKIENCGAPCDAFRAVSQELLDRLSKLEAEWMTPVPKR